MEGRAERDGMKIRVNGEEYGTEQETVEGLLGELRIEPGRVAVEVNLGVVKKKEFDHVRLSEGDTVEIVYFVGGGSPHKESRDE